MKTIMMSAVVVAASAGLAGSALGSITSVAGQTMQIGPPPSCVFGALQGQTAFAWDEQQNTPQALVADMINNGPHTGAIPGPVVGLCDSHFIHFEGIPGIIGVQGSVTFSAPIAGVMFTPLNLDNSDIPAGAGGTVYPTGYPFRGMNTMSAFTVAGNTLTFNFFSIAPTNDVIQLRVLTRVPAPGSLALLGVGGLVAGRRRR